MPTTVTYSVNVAVDKGPTIKGEAKLSTGSYSATVEDEVCPRQSIEVDLGEVALTEIDLLVISADKFRNEKEPCTVPGQSSDKTLKFAIETTGGNTSQLLCNCKEKVKQPEQPHPAVTPPDWCDLTQPFVMSKPFIGNRDGKLKKVHFLNDLATNVKVSVLVVRPCSKPCACA